MSQADVRDLDALRLWHAALATYRSDLSEVIAGLRVEAGRAVEYVREQHTLWQRSLRPLDDAIVEAKAALAAKRFPDFSGRMPDTTVEERNLRRAMAAYEHAESMIRRCRHWLTELPTIIDELFQTPVNQLMTMVDRDVPQALAQLKYRIETLERYTETRLDYGSSAPFVPSSTRPAEGQS
jgi:hypothetical protein